MGAFKDIIEPGCLVALFTLGAVVNRQNSSHAFEDLSATTKSVQSRSHMSSPYPAKERPARRDKLATRFLNAFPFVLEIVYWNLTYWSYQLARAYSASRIRDNKGVERRAVWHALQLLTLEKDLGIAIERDFQLVVLNYLPWLMRMFAFIYHSHIIVGVAFIVYCFTFLEFSRYASIRRTLFIDNWIAFIILSSWRCMPPRLLPYQEFGMIDILHQAKNGGSSWSNNRFQLKIAAMPSLHFGTSVLIAWSLWRFSPHRWVRVVCWIWPALMLFTILATANHWLLDAFVGALVPALGWRLNNVVVFARAEILWFRVLGIKRPEYRASNQSDARLDVRRMV